MIANHATAMLATPPVAHLPFTADGEPSAFRAPPVTRVRAGDIFSARRSDNLALIVSGRLVAELIMSYGVTLPLARFVAGDVLPPLDSLSTAAYWLHYRAEEPTQITRVRHAAVANDVPSRLAGAHDTLLSACMRQITALACLPAAYRLYVELLRCFRQADGAAFDLPNHSDLAARTLTTRETVSRELSLLRREGVLSGGKPTILVAPDDLEKRIARLLNLESRTDVWDVVRN